MLCASSRASSRSSGASVSAAPIRVKKGTTLRFTRLTRCCCTERATPPRCSTAVAAAERHACSSQVRIEPFTEKA